MSSPKSRSFKGREGSPGNVVSFNYELFELAHMLRVRPRTNVQLPEQSITRLNTSNQPFIQVSVWYEDEYGCLMVLLCSNGCLLVWSVCADDVPITKQIPWFQNPKRAIKAMSLDLSGCWLVCVCMDTNLYIVPVITSVPVEGRVSPKSCPWKLDDITQVEFNGRRSQPCSVIWWHTEDNFQMCIVGTELGEVMFVDLCKGIAMLSVDLKESISTLELLQDKQHQVTSVMIGTASGETWQLVLESKSLPQRHRSIDQMSSPSVASGLGYEMVGMMGIPLESFQAVTEWQDRLKPMPVKSPMGEVQFSVQHARNQVFIGAHNQRTDILQVYDTDVEHLPMFIYQLPSGTSQFILTDRLVFCVVHDNQGKTSLSIISSQLAETSQSVPRSPHRAESSIIQTFVLPKDEQVVGLFKQTKTMEGLRQASDVMEEDVDSFLPTRVYNVDGCILVTTSAVYECRPSVSPEKLFLDLAINNTDNTAADMLAITTGLDVNMLYQMAAEEALNQSKYEHAMKLYQLSKCPFSKRVAQFAKHKRIGDILTYLRQALSKHSDFHTAERKQLSNLALNCFVQQVLQFSGDTNKHQELREAFSQFLNDNFDYDEYCALKLLASHGLKEHVFDVAKARGLMIEALEVLYQTGQVHLSTDLLNKLAARGFTDVVSRSCNGSFLYSMDPKDAINFLLTKPETILSHLTFLLHHLIALDEESLVHIAHVLDPSRPSFRSLLTKLKTLPKSRSVSESSITSLISLESTVSLTMDEHRFPHVSDLLHLFLCTLLVLNYKREQEQDPCTRIMNIQYVCGHPNSSNKMNIRKRNGTIDMLCQQVKLSCGQQHTAVISASGDVYTWGKSHKGRLGHGDLIEEEGKSIPFRVEILHMHRIKVLSVACGIEHTVALCRDGVYAWGSSEYGQLGQGDTRQHTRPVFITELSDKSCIAITCGHYHSLALSADQRVWAWGWGVHGQLGMGTIEDVWLPSHVTSLDHLQVTQMAAGYSHTAVLTSEGHAYTFGGGLYGQLGLGTNKKQTLPRKVEALQDEEICLICCGSFETIAVTSNQKVFNWGRSPHFFRLHTKPEFRAKRLSSQGSSQSGSLSHRFSPMEMDCSFISRIKEIYCGNLHYLVVTEAGQVYTWGYNDHGQLGHGKKMDNQPVPKVVPGLKDKHIVNASVGAEFSVVMDTNGQVFVWGRADSGQLGLDSSLIGSAKEVSSPAVLSSLPLLTNTDQPSLPESNPSEYSLDLDWKLPDLSLIGNRGVIYGRESLTLALHALYPHYSATVMLRHCLDINDYLSTSVIYNNKNHWSEALGLRLKFLAGCKKSAEEKLDKGTFLDHAINVINYSLSLIKDKDMTDDRSNIQLQHILMEILNFWKEHCLPQDALESILNEHLTRMAYPLSILVIRDAAATSQGNSTSTPATSSNLSKLQFSTKFLNTVLELVADQIHSGEEGTEYEEDLTQMLTTQGYIVNDNAYLTVGQLKESQMSKNQLIQGIMDNLKKDLDKCSFISLSMTTAATIAAAAVSQQREWKNENPTKPSSLSTPDVLVFTCNHQFPRVYFMDNILPEFQQRMSELLVPLVNTTKTLVTHYKKSEKQLISACPVCVYNSLRAEQLEKATDANAVIGEGFKAKPWDI
ncbi:uncharacterized protein LOC116305433 [Actinia tenebrosa]|uniref:Uncharacterized protein LOC116305433 n=1 Tax=Actinia tenebrosa TaxID=6105 RepID=A0A6P8IW04_ACTTE|nr:uncharacterized protein LOC116305433 [Actinia tenebrosa]